MEMDGVVRKKTPKKEMNNPSFVWRPMADFWDTLFGYLFRFFALKLKGKVLGFNRLKWDKLNIFESNCIMDSFPRELKWKINQSKRCRALADKSGINIFILFLCPWKIVCNSMLYIHDFNWERVLILLILTKQKLLNTRFLTRTYFKQNSKVK